MDSYREFPSEFEASDDTPSAQDGGVVEIGTDERRMHVRAYNYWVSLLDGRDYPSIEDLEPGDLLDFAPNSVLLDFTSGSGDPATPYVGAAIREECGLDEEVKTIADVPSRSLLSRLTDHYLQIIANRAPVGFEAEFENQRGETIFYRGILMPFSSDGDTIDFIYGVINWKKLDKRSDPVPAQADAPAQPIDLAIAEDEALELTDPVEEEPLELTVAVEDEPLELTDSVDEEPLELTQAVDSAIEDALEIAEQEAALDPTDEVEVPMLSSAAPAADLPEPAFEISLQVELDENAGLADRLCAARENADAVREADGRSRDALYQALSSAYDFALAAKADAGGYAELLEESGVKAQARAPMTPVVKLVFGIDYDKARLTEYAAALSYADRQQVEFGGFLKFIQGQAGGLKALVAAERQARRPEPKADTKTEKAREQLRAASPLALDSLASDDEFALVLTRRSSAGVHEPVAVVDDAALVERAIRRAAA